MNRYNKCHVQHFARPNAISDLNMTCSNHMLFAGLQPTPGVSQSQVCYPKDPVYTRLHRYGRPI